MRPGAAILAALVVALLVGALSVFVLSMILFFAELALGGAENVWWELMAVALATILFLATSVVSFRETYRKLAG